MVITRAMPGLEDVAVGLIATSEKGFMNVKVTCTGAPGHSSMPEPGDTSVTVMAKAVEALNAKQQPAHFEPTSPFRQLLHKVRLPSESLQSQLRLWAATARRRPLFVRGGAVFWRGSPSGPRRKTGTLSGG